MMEYKREIFRIKKKTITLKIFSKPSGNRQNNFRGKITYLWSVDWS